MSEFSLWAALSIGLLGSAHCVGMCGGIMAALSHGLPGRDQLNLSRRLGLLAAYNLGRVTSYAAAGALLASLAGGIGVLFDLDHWLTGMRLLAGIMLILMGFYLANLSSALVMVEKLGNPLWSRLAPLARRQLPVTSPAKALAAGMLWGWLPCGLVYSTLIWALSLGSALDTVMAMTAFGLGTLPSMILVGAAADAFKKLLVNKGFKLFSALLLIVYGVHTMTIALGQFF
ncbi:sulfite exporter TauE/SafE family protein [Ferrimonas sediminicola]|uniref:Sulfite exporter TauE/SafE family protein n=1 Tax=Ferrimonas sediminicola TaxID=2569538 RepID=A0A4U1BHC8_9GAMM|nr:sulfite exporter TauE/SafE family protein [Ferrimonas sediminicola]TKB50454.1 sulfite exporter TauE/SafE family protein [Ferrimonas sediminicola]